MAPTKKSAETRHKILTTALHLFHTKGFHPTTMRDIATAAQVATGAAYYYFPSKDAIVMAFYEQCESETALTVSTALAQADTLEARLRTIIQTKFDTFSPNRELLRTLSAHIDPDHPLSPFSQATASIRLQDVDRFEHAVAASKVKLPSDLRNYLPRLLWLYQMGLILFWVYDSSPAQRRTSYLFSQTLRMVLLSIKLAGLPFLRPMHKLAAELLETIFDGTEPENPQPNPLESAS